jgi:hypothetical protein
MTEIVLSLPLVLTITVTVNITITTTTTITITINDHPPSPQALFGWISLGRQGYFNTLMLLGNTITVTL